MENGLGQDFQADVVARNVFAARIGQKRES